MPDAAARGGGQTGRQSRRAGATSSCSMSTPSVSPHGFPPSFFLSCHCLELIASHAVYLASVVLRAVLRG
jgi:hypothetical protein